MRKMAYIIQKRISFSTLWTSQLLAFYARGAPNAPGTSPFRFPIKSQVSFYLNITIYSKNINLITPSVPIKNHTLTGHGF